MAAIIGAELQLDRFISADPTNGLLAAIDATSAVVNLITWSPSTGDTTWSAPTGNGTNTRRHLFDRPILSTAAATFTSLALAGAITGVTTIVTSSNVTVGGTLGVTGATTFLATVSVVDSQLRMNHTGGGANREWRLITSNSAAGAFEIEQSTTAGGSTYVARLGISPTGNVSVGTNTSGRLFGVGGIINITNGSDLEWGDGSVSIVGNASTEVLTIAVGSGVKVTIDTTAIAFAHPVTMSSTLGISNTLTITKDGSAFDAVASTATAAITAIVRNATNILVMAVDNSAGTGLLGTGSAAYAAVIHSRFNYPLVFAVNDAERTRLTTTALIFAAGVGITIPADATALFGGASSTGTSAGDVAIGNSKLLHYKTASGTSTSSVGMNSSNVLVMRGARVIVLADGATQAIDGQGGILIVTSSEDRVGMFAASMDASPDISEIADPSGVYSTTFDTASSTNVYSTGGNLTIQNKTGGSKTYSLTYIAGA